MTVQRNNLLGASNVINEGATRTYTFTLYEEDGETPIALADLASLTLSLYRIGSGGKAAETINSREAQDVKNANNVTVHATSGLVTWLMQADDTTLTQTGRKPGAVITYRAEWTATTSAGDVFSYSEDFGIVAFQSVAAA